MKSYQYKPPVERKPVASGWVAAGAIVSALIGTGYNVSRVLGGALRRAPANASAFEVGYADPNAALIGGGFGIAIVIWLIFWALCRANKRTTGWWSFGIFAAAAIIPTFILVAAALAFAPRV